MHACTVLYKHRHTHTHTDSSCIHSFIVEDTEIFRFCHIWYRALSRGDHILFIVIICSQYKVTLCLIMSRSIWFATCAVCGNLNRKQHATTSSSLSASAQISRKTHTKATKIQGFWSFLLNFSGYLEWLCYYTNITLITAPSVTNRTMYNCSKGAVFIQSSDSCDWQSFKQMNKRENKRKGVSCFFFVWNNELWIKGESAETEVEGCGMNSDKGKRKSFGLLKCKAETQESAFALISLFECERAFLSSRQYVLFTLCYVGLNWSKHTLELCWCYYAAN